MLYALAITLLATFPIGLSPAHHLKIGMASLIIVLSVALAAKQIRSFGHDYKTIVLMHASSCVWAAGFGTFYAMLQFESLPLDLTFSVSLCFLGLGLLLAAIHGVCLHSQFARSKQVASAIGHPLVERQYIPLVQIVIVTTIILHVMSSVCFGWLFLARLGVVRPQYSELVLLWGKVSMYAPAIAICMLVLATAMLCAFKRRLRLLASDVLCAHCAYPLKGLATSVCPECGKGHAVRPE